MRAEILLNSLATCFFLQFTRLQKRNKCIVRYFILKSTAVVFMPYYVLLNLNVYEMICTITSVPEFDLFYAVYF